jgi:micrococcal nuclease
METSKKRIVLWVFAGLFLIFILPSLFGGGIFDIICFLAIVALLIPQTKKLLANKYNFDLSKKIKIISIIVLLLIISITPPVKNTDQVKTENAETQTTDITTEIPPINTDTLAVQEENQPVNPDVKSDSNKPTNTEAQTTPVSQATPQYTYYSVVSVVDGDTIKINMGGTTETLRLIGIDTPETVDPRKPVQCFGIEASNKAKELLENKKVRIEKDSTQGERDKYSRLLAYIFREDGLFYNKYIIEQGYAHEYTYGTPYKYQAEFKAAEKVARENLRGLWSPDTCNGDTTSNTTTSPQTSTQTSGKFYTSSASNTKYYAPESCNYWKTWKESNVRAFDSLEELLRAYPSRTLSPQCQ